MLEQKDEMTEEFMEREMPMEMPEGMMEEAARADELESTMFQAIAPEGVFSRNALNTFVKGINEALKLFPGAEPVAEFEDNLDGPMPEQVSRALGMIHSAYSDFSGEEPFTFQDIKTDRDLKEVAGKLMAFGKDKSFRAFLAKPMGEEGVEAIGIRIGRTPEEKPEMEMSGNNEEDLLMSRLR